MAYQKSDCTVNMTCETRIDYIYNAVEGSSILTPGIFTRFDINRLPNYFFIRNHKNRMEWKKSTLWPQISLESALEFFTNRKNSTKKWNSDANITYGTLKIKDLQKTDYFKLPCITSDGVPTTLILEVHQQHDLIELNCPDFIYVDLRDFPTPVQTICRFKSIHDISDIFVEEEFTKRDINGSYYIDKKHGTVDISIMPDQLYQIDKLAVTLKSLPSIRSHKIISLQTRWLSRVSTHDGPVAVGQEVKDMCSCEGFPQPKLILTYRECLINDQYPECGVENAPAAENALKLDIEYSNTNSSATRARASVTFEKLHRSGILTCTAKNDIDMTKEANISICLYDPNIPFSILGKRVVPPGESAQIICQVPNCLNKSEEKGEKMILKKGISTSNVNVTIQRSMHYYNITHEIKAMSAENEGVYTCASVPNKELFVMMGPTSTSTGIIIGATFLVIFVILLVSMGNILYRRRQHRNRNIRLANELKKGDINSINPDLPLHEQADLLPLHSKWEFPRNQLKLEKQLGAGFFGVVLQGEAMGIIPNEVKTKVAVKIAKKYSEGHVVRALVAELKIMSHMGRHPFVIRLLGAVIDGLGDNELMVVVEYCHFGNLNSYLLKNRRRFVDNWMNRHLAYANLNKDVSAGCSSGQDVAYEVPRGGASSGENVSFLKNEADAQEMPLNTNILIGWSYQIARGMEWLASKWLMHGDLAARNILLTSNNIVKICDFGLAKNLYTKDYYKCKQDAKKPVKWLALESLTDQVFTLKSDVWAYAVLLWEIFGLGKTPYPELEKYGEILENLQRGNRLPRPEFAPEPIFQMMLQCWDQDPDERPLFSELSSILCQLLDNTHRTFLIEQEASGLHSEETECDFLLGGAQSIMTKSKYQLNYL